MTPPLPARVGRYEVVDRLGRGGMGVVYLAKDPVLGRTVAVKMLTEDNEELRERFAREARSAAALAHANIVTIYDVGEDDGHPFIAMQYLDGETMSELVKRRAPIPLGRKLELMAELCDGLGYAHRCGIVHRDIKPANLMVTSEGTLKILDFGIARVATDATFTGLTRIGAVMGSTHYMAPEQAEGLQVDERSDIFAVGLVFYELLTLERAFPGNLAHVVLHNIVHKEPRPVHEFYPDIDPELERIVTKCLAKDPAKRYKALAELASNLERFQDQLETAETTLIFKRDSEGVQEKNKSGGSGSKSIRNWQEIDERRRALVESHLAEASGQLEAERYEDAINQCEQVLLLSPEEPRALQMIERAHRAVDARQVREWLVEAQTLVSKGQITAAERLVGRAIDLQPDSAEGRAALADLKERRREQERAADRARRTGAALAKAVASMEAGAFEAALRGATEALAFDPASGDARAILQKAKAAIEARDAQIARDRRAGEVVASARQLVVDEDPGQALRILRDFSPPHPTVTAAIAEAEEASAALEKRRRDEREAAERQAKLAAEEARRLQAAERAAREAEARQAQVAAEEESRLPEATRTAREEDRRRSQASLNLRDEVEPATQIRQRSKETGTAPRPGVPAQTPPPQIEKGPATATSAHEARASEPQPQPWYRKLAVTVPAALLVVAGLAFVAWQSTRNSGRGGGGGQAQPTVTVQPPPPPPASEYPAALADAKKDRAAERFLEAIGQIRKIPNGVPEFAEAQALLGSIRSDAANVAARARKNAERAGARPSSLRDGDEKMRLAGKQADVEGAVSGYLGAKESFDLAGEAASTPQELMQQAREAQTRNNLRDAISLATRALKSSPGWQPALTFLSGIRSGEAARTANAKNNAIKAGALQSLEKFREGVRLELEAGGLPPAETQAAIDKYAEATAAFNQAASQAGPVPVQTPTPSPIDIRPLDQLLREGRVADARRQFDELPKSARSRPDMIDLERRIGEAEREAERAKAKAEAADLLRRSINTPDHKTAIQLLDKAQALDSTNEEIRRELDKRRAALNPPPPPPPTGGLSKVEEDAVRQVLTAYGQAYSRKDLKGMQGLFPGMPRGVQNAYKATFDDHASVAWEYVSIGIQGDETVVVAGCVVKLSAARSAKDKPTGENRVFSISLRKAPPREGGGWRVFDVKCAGCAPAPLEEPTSTAVLRNSGR